MFLQFLSQWGGTPGAAPRLRSSTSGFSNSVCAAALASIFILLSSHIEHSNLITREGNFHNCGMMNEEHYLISNWAFWAACFWMPVVLGTKLAFALFDSNYTSVERRGKEEQGGVVWALSKDHLVKLAVFLWTPGGSGVPACFWEWQLAPVGLARTSNLFTKTGVHSHFLSRRV